ncbi:negative elongation factor B-like isoform X2 [Dermacentor albipictus]|uniref:negative elongation factor B-like isoform X2 n=1 Tax=Dermacentor albipictus TaxID=60249 RepID=UPI0031FD6710
MPCRCVFRCSTRVTDCKRLFQIPPAKRDTARGKVWLQRISRADVNPTQWSRVCEDPALRPVVMCILKNVKSMDEKYIKLLVSDKSLYKECDIQVKRQIWHDNKDLFAEEVLPLLSQYVSEKEEALAGLAASVAGESPSSFFGPTPKQRRQGAVLQRLLAMVDRSLVLYKMVVQFARNRFLRTQNAHYCTLRVELLMALHDLEIQEITAKDRSHKFAWCLDACIREKSMDDKRSRELQSILDVKRGQEELLCDLAMTLCDPYAINFLGQSALKSMTHLIKVEGMPRDNHFLVLLLRMLALGMEAWTMLNTENYTEPKLDVQLFTKFLPSLMCLMVDDQLRKRDSRTNSQDDQGSANANTDYSGPVPETFQAYVQGNPLASVLAVFYVLHVARQRDRTGLLRVLGTLATAEGRRAYRDPFLHTLVGHLTRMADHFAREDFCMVIFDDFFLRGLRSSAPKGNRHAESTRITAKHLMRLLWHVHAKLPPARLNGLVKKLQPFAQTSEVLKSAYKGLLEKIKYVPPEAAGRGSANPALPSSPALTSI